MTRVRKSPCTRCPFRIPPCGRPLSIGAASDRRESRSPVQLLHGSMPDTYRICLVGDAEVVFARSRQTCLDRRVGRYHANSAFQRGGCWRPFIHEHGDFQWFGKGRSAKIDVKPACGNSEKRSSADAVCAVEQSNWSKDSPGAAFTCAVITSRTAAGTCRSPRK